MSDTKPDFLREDERDLLAECDRLGGALAEAFKEHFSRLAEARRVLAQFEWSHYEDSHGRPCIICGSKHPQHASDCQLAAALEGVER